MRRCATLAAAAVMTLLFVDTAGAQKGLRAYYQDDFVLESADRAFQLKIRGNIHFDTRIYQGESKGSPHSFDIRRARIDLQGRLFSFLTYRVQAELAGQPYIRNAWLDVRIRSWLRVRIGQMKVPYSSSWLTLDNNVNFVERGASTPIYPFFDRGLKIWGELWRGTLTYNVGVYTGAGIDADASGGDQDDFKDLAARVMVQPFKLLRYRAIQGIFLVAQSTWGLMSSPTTRFETGGLRSANYETAIWRWRTEQTLGTDGRVTDRVAATARDRVRLGAELHYLWGPLALSVEYLETRYRDVTIQHEQLVGSTTQAQELVAQRSGVIRSLSAFASVYLTGEHKRLTDGGWKTAKVRKPVGEGGAGAWELLLRYSWTRTDAHLFDKVPVAGYTPASPALPIGYAGATPGALNQVSVSVLDGAHEVHEFTLGLVWTVNNMLRIQLNDVFLWAPPSDRNGDGVNDNLLVSGAKSNQADLFRKYRKMSWENTVMLRVIFKL
jgi:phosphate-selective porin